MSTFDPDEAGATLDFTDGVTQVNANFLDAVTVRFASGRDAWRSLKEGDIGLIVDQNPSVQPLEPIVATAVTGSYGNLDWDVNAEKLFCLQGGTGMTVEARSLEDFSVFSPAEEYTVSWASGSIDWVAASDRYLAVGGEDTGAGVDKVDIWDLDDGSLAGTFVLASDVLVAAAPPVFFDDKMFVHTYDGSANHHIEAVELSSGNTYSAWGTSGKITLNYGSGKLAIDDAHLYHFDGDDMEVLDPSDGTSLWTQAGIGSGTTSAGVVDGEGHVFFYQATGSEFLSKWRIDDANSLQQEWELTMTNGHAAALYFDGRWIGLRESGGAEPIVFFDARTGTKWLQGPDGWTANGGKLVWDGLHWVTVVTTAGGASVDGFARIKGPARERRVMKLKQGSYGRGPWKAGLVPVDL